MMIGDWMLNLVERVDHESRLIPFVISALSDESPDISAKAVEILSDLGKQYEREHSEDLKDAIYYLPHEAHSLGWGEQNSIEKIWQGPQADEKHGVPIRRKVSSLVQLL